MAIINYNLRQITNKDVSVLDEETFSLKNKTGNIQEILGQKYFVFTSFHSFVRPVSPAVFDSFLSGEHDLEIRHARRYKSQFKRGVFRVALGHREQTPVFAIKVVQITLDRGVEFSHGIRVLPLDNPMFANLFFGSRVDAAIVVVHLVADGGAIVLYGLVHVDYFHHHAFWEPCGARVSRDGSGKVFRFG